MTARFLHVSDLHFGAGRDAEIEVGLSRLLENLDLELIEALSECACCVGARFLDSEGRKKCGSRTAFST